MRFALSRQDEQFFGDLWDYYFYQGGKPLADRVLSQIYDAIQHLCDQPNLGHRREDLTDEPFLFYRIFSILIIYDPASSPLYVAYAYHASQDVGARMRRDGRG